MREFVVKADLEIALSVWVLIADARDALRLRKLGQLVDNVLTSFGPALIVQGLELLPLLPLLNIFG